MCHFVYFCFTGGYKMIDIPRDDLVVMLEAGYIYLAMRKYKEAKQVFEGVLALAPKHDIPQVALANLYFAQSKFLEAIRTLKKAIKDNPNSAYAYAHLGESQLFYGKKEEAMASLQKALEIDEEEKVKEFTESLIQLIETGYDPKAYKKVFQKYVSEKKA